MTQGVPPPPPPQGSWSVLGVPGLAPSLDSGPADVSLGGGAIRLSKVGGELVLITGSGSTPVTGPSAGRGTIYGTYATRPAPNTVPAGTRYVCSDPGIVEFLCDGVAWRPLIAGRIGTESAPGGSVSGYTFINTSSLGTISQKAGVARLTGGSGANADHVIMANLARASGQGIEACLLGGMTLPTGSTVAQYGVCLYNPTSTNIYTCAIVVETGQVVAQCQIFSNPTTFSGNIMSAANFWVSQNAPVWLKITDDGVHYNFLFALDGVNYFPFGQQPIASGFTQAGFFVDPVNIGAQVDALSLVVS